MQTATELINQKNFQLSIEQIKKPKNTLRVSGVKLEIRAAMTTLWQRMAERYGAVFTNQYGAAKGEAWQTWTLEAQDLSVEMIRLGFKKLVSSLAEYPPTLPGFINLCKSSPEDFGLPNAQEAYEEACRNCHAPSQPIWSHPAVRVAGKKTGWYVLKTFEERKSFPRFKNSYSVVVDRVIRGENIEEKIPEALSKTVFTPLSVEDNKSRMQAMRTELGI